MGASELSTFSTKLSLTGGTMTGNLALGTGSASTTLNNVLNISGGTSANQYVAGGTIQSGVTSTAVAYQSFIGTAAAAFTLNSLIHFRAGNGGVGAGSTVTAQYGFYYDSAASGGGQNFAFSGNLAANGTSNYNLYMAGSANYLAGSLGIGKTPNASLDYRGTVSVIGTNTTAVASRTYVLTASLVLTLPASPTAGDWVEVQNSSGTLTASIGRNGSNIMSLAEDMTINVANAAFRLVYADATRGWVLN